MGKILLVIDTLQTGGAEKSLLEIASRFKKYEPVVCTLFSKNSDLKASFEERGIPLIDLNLKGRLWLINGIAILKEVVEDVKPQLIHATLFKSELLTRLAFNGKKKKHIGSFVNDSYASERYKKQTRGDNFKLELYRIIDSLTAKRTTHFLSITNAISITNSKALGIEPDKITTIYRGRSIGNYIVEHPDMEDLPFTFLTVARLLKRKGYLELISAAQILKNHHMHFKIQIAGDGPDKKLFIDTIKEKGLEEQFEFLGTRKDIPVLLSQSHCFVFPSHYEGQGGALVEAMLSGKPIVATKIPVIEEQVADGEAAMLFNVFDSVDLATKMLWVYQNYSHAIQMGLKARKIAEEKFDIEKVAEQHEQLYTKVLAEQK